MRISNDYAWLGDVPNAPLMIKEAVRIGKLNTYEIPGPRSNPEIMKLAEIAGVRDIYKNDDTAWCAVAMCAICILIYKMLPFSGFDRLRAKSFLQFGVKAPVPMFGDILVFTRTGGGHVGMYVGEDASCYHVVGGNQGNQYNVIRVAKNRLTEARRPNYINQPKSVKRVYLAPSGMVSQNES